MRGAELFEGAVKRQYASVVVDARVVRTAQGAAPGAAAGTAPAA